MPLVRFVAVNENGMRIGESHPNSRLSDATVDRIRDMHEDEGKGYRLIAKELGLSRHTVRDICRYTRRAQAVDHWKKIEVKP